MNKVFLRVLCFFAATFLNIQVYGILDLDSDGTSDIWEDHYGADLPANVDSDGDGMLNSEEYARGTNPLVADSSKEAITITGDGTNGYGVEFSFFGGVARDFQLETIEDLKLLNWTPGESLPGADLPIIVTENMNTTRKFYRMQPLGAQPDGDGDTLDGVEESILGSDNTKADSDGDGLGDRFEAIHRNNGFNPNSPPGQGEDPSGDNEPDGLSNAEEEEAGTNPTLADTDGDGVNDDIDGWANETTNPKYTPPRIEVMRYGLIDAAQSNDTGFFLLSNNVGQGVIQHNNPLKHYFFDQGAISEISMPSNATSIYFSDMSDSGIVVGAYIYEDTGSSNVYNQAAFAWQNGQYTVLKNYGPHQLAKTYLTSQRHSYYKLLIDESDRIYSTYRYGASHQQSNPSQYGHAWQVAIVKWETQSASPTAHSHQYLIEDFYDQGNSYENTENTDLPMYFAHDVDDQGVLLVFEGDPIYFPDERGNDGIFNGSFIEVHPPNALLSMNPQGDVLGYDQATGESFLLMSDSGGAYTKKNVENGVWGAFNNRYQAAAGGTIWQNYTTYNLNDLTGQEPDTFPEWIINGATSIDEKGVIYGGATHFYEGSTNPEAQVYKPVLLIPIELTWEKIDGDYPDLDDNVNPFTQEVQGQRIFPGKKTPSDTLRNKVTLKVDVGIPNAQVYVKAFDVDDPTPTIDDEKEDGTYLIDPNDSSTEGVGDDNREDHVIPSGKEAGFFTSSDTATANKQSDVQGIAEFEFNIGMQPGNNYRVVASVFNEDIYADVQVTDPAATGYLGPDEDDTPTPASPLLTVWRKLHLEVDSMEAPPEKTQRESPDNITETGISWALDTPNAGRSTLTIDGTLPENENFYSNGEIVSGTTRFPIYSNADNLISNDTIVINGVPSATEQAKFIGQSFEVIDDDDLYISTLSLPDPIPQHGNSTSIIEAIMPRYAEAYIELVDANDLNLNPNKTIPFSSNEGVSSSINPISSYFLQSLDLGQDDEGDFWAFTVVYGYQPQSGLDADPDPGAEGRLLGGIPEGGLYVGYIPNKPWGFGVIYMETIREKAIPPATPLVLENPASQQIMRESYYSLFYGITAHEIGHAPGRKDEDGDHAELGLMQEGGANINSPFFPKTIQRFRDAKSWRE
ncbi:MAG: hypothetical protein AAFY98_09420 [Verrucomicrobiota bacterium]